MIAEPALKRRTRVSTLERLTPIFHLASTYLYASAFYYAYVYYLFPVWGYYGFTFHAPEFVEFIFAGIVLFLPSILFPAFMIRPSTVIIAILHSIVFVPSVVITLCLTNRSMEQYGGIMAALSLGFFLLIAIVRFKSVDPGDQGGVFSQKMSGGLLLVWLTLLGILLAVYGSTMRFASLDEIYQQRESSGNIPSTALSYVNSYFGTFFSPALLTIGLTQRKLHYIALGAVGCIVIYTISASRTMFLLPVVILLFYFAVRNGKATTSWTPAVPSFLAVCVFLVVLNQSLVDSGGTLAIYFLFRNLALPGLTISQYYDVFSTNGFTYWSHVKGISLIVPPPEAFVNDPLWPGLGYIIGDRVYGEPRLDANANLFSGDGAAAAGAVGLLVISIFFGVWLRLLDKLSAKWDRNLTLLTAAPIAIQLTNGHFFTMLMSFGGGLLMIVLYYGVPVPPPISKYR
jgi:hypothetical protein